MILTFLGTAAAEGYPNPFCRCKNCERSRVLGGPSLRKRSSALINDDLLIDLGPDLVAASVMHGRPLGGLRYCLQTHAHADHLDPSHFLSRSPEYGVPDAPRLHFYASAATAQQVTRILEADFAPARLLDLEVGERLNLEIHQVEALQTIAAGPYRVTAVPANHGPAGETLLYAIEADGRSIFYGTDTAALPEATWQAFRWHKLRFEVVILDHTYGYVQAPDDHLNAYQFIEHVARMRDEGLLADDGRIFATHLAHETTPPHQELAEIAAQHGYEVAHDGLTVWDDFEWFQHRLAGNRHRFGELPLVDLDGELTSLCWQPEGWPTGFWNALLDEGPFIATNGDVLTGIDLTEVIEAHIESDALATITLTSVDDPTAYGLVEVDHRLKVKRFVEKPSSDEVHTSLINAGIYVLERQVLNMIPEGQEVSIEREIFPQLQAMGQLSAFVSSAYWRDIGTPRSYLAASNDVLSGAVGRGDFFKQLSVDRAVNLSKDVSLLPPVSIA